jgi:hypothetical protein
MAENDQKEMRAITARLSMFDPFNLRVGKIGAAMQDTLNLFARKLYRDRGHQEEEPVYYCSQSCNNPYRKPEHCIELWIT